MTGLRPGTGPCSVSCQATKMSSDKDVSYSRMECMNLFKITSTVKLKKYFSFIVQSRLLVAGGEKVRFCKHGKHVNISE